MAFKNAHRKSSNTANVYRIEIVAEMEKYALKYANFTIAVQ